jgi:hypothetical protein
MASWTILEEQTVWVSARATSFTVVCEGCKELGRYDGYSAATVTGMLALDRQRGWLMCPRGHQLRVERDTR